MNIPDAFVTHAEGPAWEEGRATMHAVASGSLGAFGWVYDETAGCVLTFIRALIRDQLHADTLLKETYFTAWQQARTFPARSESVTAWICEIAYRRISEYRRREEVSPPEPQHEEGFSNVIVCLSALEREYVALALYVGLTQYEISARTSQPLSSVRGGMRRSLSHLRDCKRDCGPAASVILAA